MSDPTDALPGWSLVLGTFAFLLAVSLSLSTALLGITALEEGPMDLAIALFAQAPLVLMAFALLPALPGWPRWLAFVPLLCVLGFWALLWTQDDPRAYGLLALHLLASVVLLARIGQRPVG